MIAVAFGGAVLAGFRAKGMALAMLAAGIVHAVAGGIGFPEDPRTGPITLAFVAMWLGSGKSDQLYTSYAPGRFSLADQGYIAGVHPLELWLVGYLDAQPGATLRQVYEASSDERIAVYQWLFSRHRKRAQDRRIKSLLEIEAFLEVHRNWQLHGYPFDSLVPSLATAIGSAADRPSALAELAGIIANDGVRKPAIRIAGLRFAGDTPYETSLVPAEVEGARVMPEAVARALRAAMVRVVEHGTAVRANGVVLSRVPVVCTPTF